MNFNYLAYKHGYLQSKFSLRIIKNLNVCWTVTFSIFLRPEWRILWGKKTQHIFCVLFLFISSTQMFQESLISSIASEKKNSQKTTEPVVQVLSLELSEWLHSFSLKLILTAVLLGFFLGVSVPSSLIQQLGKFIKGLGDISWAPVSVYSIWFYRKWP